MSKSKRTFLRGLLFAILSIVPVAGLAVMTSAGPGASSSSTDSSMNQNAPATTPQQDQGMTIMPSASSSASVETPVGGSDASVDVPGIEPGIDINADTSEVGVSVTSDTVPATGQMHQQSNGISEAPNPITPPGPGANGVPEQPVPNSPPGGTLAPKGDMSAGQQMGGMTMMTTPAVDHQSTSTEGSQVPVVATHYYRGHDGQVIYYSNGGGYSYYGPRHYAHQPYDYQYPYRGYAYYPYEDYYLYYNYNWGW